jgi:pimeloyl-ACP methyl ester carboxylesterase
MSTSLAWTVSSSLYQLHVNMIPTTFTDSWLDHARDLLHMINHFRSEMPLPIIGVGHSMGSNELVNLSLMHPRIFSTLVLMEPVIQEISENQNADSGHIPTRLSTFRRDIWPSKAAAMANFKKQSYYQLWDQRVLELWIEHGIRPTPTTLYPDERGGAVTLSTTKHQEVRSFLRPMFSRQKGADDEAQRDAYPDLDPTINPEAMPFYRPEVPSTFHRLKYLRPSVLYIFGETSDLSTPSLRAQKVNRTGISIFGSGGAAAGRVKELTINGRGHLVPMEVVDECATAIGEWTGKELQRWAKAQREYEEWTKLPLRDRQEVTEEWKTKIGGPMRNPPTKPKL